MRAMTFAGVLPGASRPLGPDVSILARPACSVNVEPRKCRSGCDRGGDRYSGEHDE